MYNGFDWDGRTLEVREVGPGQCVMGLTTLTQHAQDRYAGLSGPGSYRGGLRGVRGGYRGGLRGSVRGGYRGGYGGGREFNDGLYAPYSGPDQAGGAMNGYDASYGAGYGGYETEPSQQIMVRNVSGRRLLVWGVELTGRSLQLPWSTANEDLVELFETTGQVELAEILFEGTRSKGCGVVQFSQVQEAETAIGES